MNKRTSKNNGFTIVELLIVIVVIGILAAIVIVAYQGVQTRAKNAQMISAARAYVQVLTRYGIEQSSYPKDEAGMGPGVCLGSGYPANHCWTGTSNYDVNSTFDNLVKAYMPSKPAVSTKIYQVNTNLFTSGVVYVRADASVRYFLDGHNQDCAVNGVTGANWGINGAKATFCMVALPAL